MQQSEPQWHFMAIRAFTASFSVEAGRTQNLPDKVRAIGRNHAEASPTSYSNPEPVSTISRWRVSFAEPGVFRTRFVFRTAGNGSTCRRTEH